MRANRVLVLGILLLSACVAGESGDSAPTRISVQTETNEAIGTAGPTTAPPATTTTPGPLPAAKNLTCWESTPVETDSGIVFEDITQASALIEPLTGMYGHAAAWGDPSGDDIPDLVFGTFGDRPTENYRERGATGPSPDRLLLGGPGFSSINGLDLELGRTSGAVFADLDGDGDDDLVLARNAGLSLQSDVPSVVLANNDGTLSPVFDSGLPTSFLGRSIGVLDADHDGRLDLVIVEDQYGDNGTRLLRNVGDLQFEDVTTAAGLPEKLLGLGIATGDVTNDGWTDFFIGGSNRLFISDGNLAFHEVRNPDFEWETFGNEDLIAGAAFGDLNRDGLPDLVVGHHYNSTIDFGVTVPIRLYLHRGIDAAGDPIFEDVTDAAGLVGLPTKAPHVAIEDIDNDGWPDIVTTASADDGTRPAIFHSVGVVDGIPQFTTPRGLGDPQYWVAGPVADVDRDGRLDVLVVEWLPSLPSLLLRNVSSTGNWLEVSLAASGRGVGTVVSVYEAGMSGNPDHLIGWKEIVVSGGYTAGTLPYAHFGLGDYEQVDVVVRPPGIGAIHLNGIEANRHIRLPDGCGF